MFNVETMLVKLVAQIKIAYFKIHSLNSLSRIRFYKKLLFY